MEYRAVRCILSSENCFLLAIHNNILPQTIGKWGLPGGRIDNGEDFATTAQREMCEEFGLSLTEWQDIGEYPYRGSLQKVLATKYDGSRNLQYDRNEILNIAWYTFGDIQAMHNAGKMHTGFEFDAISKFLSLREL
ncbi:MAG: NUDIX hydrolase [Chloroflexota bacterium]